MHTCTCRVLCAWSIMSTCTWTGAAQLSRTHHVPKSVFGSRTKQKAPPGAPMGCVNARGSTPQNSHHRYLARFVHPCSERPRRGAKTCVGTGPNQDDGALEARAGSSNCSSTNLSQTDFFKATPTCSSSQPNQPECASHHSLHNAFAKGNGVHASHPSCVKHNLLIHQANTLPKCLNMQVASA